MTRRPALVGLALLALLAAWAAMAVVVLTGCGGAGPTREQASTTSPASSAPAAPAAGRTAFGDTPGRTAVVWAVGDGAIGTPQAAALGRRIAADHPDRFLYLGDVYEAGSPHDFQVGMTGAYGPLLSRTLPTPGNHEWGTRAIGYDPYWAAVTGAQTPSYYAVEVGRWQVLSLNSEDDHGADSPQVRWLHRQLQQPARCRLAFWHRPRFSAGNHGDQADVVPLWNAVAGRAALVLNGHDHDLQRLRPVNGTTEIVDGAGGKSHYAIDRTDPRLMVADDQRDIALRLVLRPDRADVTAQTADGTVVDRMTARCR